MPRNNDGTFTPPTNSASPAVPLTQISSADFNTLIGDLVGGLADSLSRSGKGAMQSGLDMAGNPISNLPAPGGPNNPARLADVTALQGTLGVLATKDTISNADWSGADLSVANGGTGASTAPDARSNLGLGSLAVLSSVNDSNWSGTPLSILNGGTGSTSASGARTALGLGSLATLNVVNDANWSGADLSIANGGTGSSTVEAARTSLGVPSRAETVRVVNGQIPNANGEVTVTASLGNLPQNTIYGRISAGEGAGENLTPAQVMQVLAAVLAGEYVYLPGGTIPAGRRILKANGASINRADYPHLWAYAQGSGILAASQAAKTPAQFGPGNGTTTFTIPDARGYFLRAFDDGRGIDVSRVLSAIQASQNLAHRHPGEFAVLYFTGENTGTVSVSVPGGNSGNVTPSGPGVFADGGSESRPVNLAAVLGIRY